MHVQVSRDLRGNKEGLGRDGFLVKVLPPLCGGIWGCLDIDFVRWLGLYDIASLEADVDKRCRLASEECATERPTTECGDRCQKRKMGSL